MEQLRESIEEENQLETPQAYVTQATELIRPFCAFFTKQELDPEVSDKTIDAIAITLFLIHSPSVERNGILSAISKKQYVQINVRLLTTRVETNLLECIQLSEDERMSFQRLLHRLELLCDELERHSSHLPPQ